MCKREGCDKAPRARGLCNTHYKAWRADMRRKGLAPAGNKLRDTLGKYLPGTREQVAERSGHGYDWAYKVMNALRAEKKLFIYDWQAPQHLGDKWQPIFAMGSEPDAELDPKRKYLHARTRKTQRARTREGKKPAPAFAGLLAPLNTSLRYAVPSAAVE